MSAPMTEAMKTAKQIQAEMVQWENRLEFLKSECERLTKTKGSLQDEIDKKISDYQIFIAQKDSDSKRMRQETVDAKSDLERQKAEFVQLLQNHQNDKVSLADEKRSFDQQKNNVEGQLNNVRQFIIAVQRALTVLGI